MPNTVPVTIDVESEVAAALDDPATRARVGRYVSLMLRPRAGPSALAQATADPKAEARKAGLTDADIDAKVDIYNVERRK